MCILLAVPLKNKNTDMSRARVGDSLIDSVDVQCQFRRWVVAVLVVIVGTCANQAHAVELIENGSFEADGRDLGPLVTGWGDANAGTNNKGFGIEDWPYYENGELIQGITNFEFPFGEIPDDFTGGIAPLGAGNLFGFRWGVWNGTGFRGSATQTINLAAHAGRRYEFSAWLASILGDNDHAVVGLELFTGANASGTSLGLLVFDGNDQESDFIVGSLNLEGFADLSIPATQNNWTLYRASGTIPQLAQSAAVTIRGAVPPGDTGFGNNAYVDLVSLQVVPEPSSAALACLFGALAAAWWLQRRTCIRIVGR